MFKNKLELEEAGTKTFALAADLVYEGRDEIFVIPKGFVTDFASVPQFMYWLIPSYGAYTKAAVVHDYLCVELKKEWRCEFGRDMKFVRAPASPVDTDGIFRRIMRELDEEAKERGDKSGRISPVTRWLMWTGVRWGALFSPYRRAGWLSTMFPTIGISLLALLFLLVPTLFILITLGIDKVVEKL